MIRKEFVINSKSKNNGLTILITAGLHGDEQSSVYAVDQFIHMLETKQFVPYSNIYKIIIYNYVNLDGILVKQRYCSNLDLNREFAQIVSANKDVQRIKRDIKVNKVDVAIDVHTSFNSTEFLFLDCDKYTQSFMDFLNKLHINYVISPDPNKNTLKSYINSLSADKIGLTLELNQNGKNIDIASALRGVGILQKLINNISQFKKTVKQVPMDKKSLTLTADLTGFLKLNDILGKNVTRGEKLGYILSLDKTRMINILAPCDGKIIVYPSYLTYISVGFPILTIQPD